MANSDSRSVGRPSNNPGRMERRSVPIQHDAPRINDQRKVRPHAAGTPPMGNRPSGGAQKPLKAPPLNKAYMGMRDVAVARVTEANYNDIDRDEVPWGSPPPRRTQGPQGPQGQAPRESPWSEMGSNANQPYDISQRGSVSPMERPPLPQTGRRGGFSHSLGNTEWGATPPPAGPAGPAGPEMAPRGIDPTTPEAPQRDVSGGITLGEKVHLLKLVDPQKYDDNTIQKMMAGGHTYQIDSAYNRLRKSMRAGGGMRESIQRGHVGKTIKACRAMGMRCTHDPGSGEFRVNHPHNREGTAYYTNDPDDAVGTAHHMKKTSMGEGYPDTNFERDEPAHEARIGDLGWDGYPEEASLPALNRDFAQFRDLPVEKIHEMAEAEITNLVRRTAARLGFKDLVIEEDESLPTPPVQTQHSAIPRVRCRWFAEAGLPKPKRPLPPNIAGSGKNFHVKPGTNNARKQPGRLAGSGKAMKVKPGFIG